MNEQQTVRSFLQSQITDATEYLDEARSRYSELNSRDNPYSQHPSGSSASIDDAVKNACKFVRQYPVEIGYDRHWETFSDYTEALLDYLNDGVLEKTDYEDQFVDTPQVTGDELHKRFDYTMVDIMLFLEQTGIRLDSRRSFSLNAGALDYAELGDAAFTAGINSLPDLVDWVFEDRHVTQFDMSSALNRAIVSLSAARRYYDQASNPADSAGRSPTQNYKRLSQEIITACNDIKQYPAVIGYDNHWKMFVRYTEDLLSYIDDDVYGQTRHCLPRMKRAVKRMQETVGSPFG